MTKRLYYHKTDGWAEYLCTSPVDGTDEGDLWTIVVRLDGEPELMGRFEVIEDINAELLTALEVALDNIYMMCHNESWYKDAQAVITKAKQELP